MGNGFLGRGGEVEALGSDGTSNRKKTQPKAVFLPVCSLRREGLID